MSKSLSLKEFLPYRCANLAERISLSLSRIYVERFGVSIPEWRVLATLAEHPQLLSKDVGVLTNMDKVRVSRAVSTLVERQLVDRSPCDRDSRASNLSLSADGRRLYRKIVPEALAWEAELVAPLSDAEQETLSALLDKLDQRLGAIEAGS